MASPMSQNRLQNYIITDYFTNYEDITKIPGPEEINKKVHRSKYHPFRILNLIHPYRWIFLILVAIITVLSGY